VRSDHCSARLSGTAPDSACVPRRPAATDALKRLRPTVRSVTATATRYSSSHSGVVATLGDDIHPPAVCELFARSVDDLLARVGVCAPHSLYGRQRVGARPLTCGGCRSRSCRPAATGQSWPLARTVCRWFSNSSNRRAAVAAAGDNLLCDAIDNGRPMLSLDALSLSGESGATSRAGRRTTKSNAIPLLFSVVWARSRTGVRPGHLGPGPRPFHPVPRAARGPFTRAGSPVRAMAATPATTPSTGLTGAGPAGVDQRPFRCITHGHSPSGGNHSPGGCKARHGSLSLAAEGRVGEAS
jgi:hypothetical protein